MPRLDPPDARTCERCGRSEVWSDDRATWVAADATDESTLGSPHCVHIWDITGTYNPVVP
jgi:hypothetical protein